MSSTPRPQIVVITVINGRQVEYGPLESRPGAKTPQEGRPWHPWSWELSEASVDSRERRRRRWCENNLEWKKIEEALWLNTFSSLLGSEDETGGELDTDRMGGGGGILTPDRSQFCLRQISGQDKLGKPICQSDCYLWILKAQPFPRKALTLISNTMVLLNAERW